MLKILIVDDEPNTLELHIKYLEKNKIEVDIEKEFGNVIKLIESQRYDIIVIDLMFPKNDGNWDLKAGINFITANLKIFNPYIISSKLYILTSLTKNKYKSLAAQLKITAKNFIEKPVGIEELYQQLNGNKYE